MLTFISIILIVIIVHEFGHYLAARMCGVKVEIFSVGFGKVLLKKQAFGTEWRLSLLPLGGYVRMKGDTDYTVTDDPTTFWGVHPLKRAWIAFAGPFANLILPYFLYFAFIVGQSWPGAVVPAGAEPTRIGIVQAAKFSHMLVKKSIMDMGSAFHQNLQRAPELKDLGGPIAIYEVSAKVQEQAVEKGDWGFLVDWLVFMSINLGVINLLPIPILDGGHIVISLGEAVTRRRLSLIARNVLSYIGISFVFILMGLAITSDLVRIFG